MTDKKLQIKDTFYQEIRELILQARQKVWTTINTTMVETYWQIGKRIVEKEQGGKEKAEYGESIIPQLAEQLAKEFGKGFDRSNVFHMRDFYLTYPKVDAVSRELSWTHYRLLLKVEKSEVRLFYEKEAIAARWSTRELDRQIASLYFERLLLSRDKKGMLELGRKGHELHDPKDLVKDPYVLEFTGIPENTKFLESTLEQALITRMEEFLLELGKGFSFVGRQQRITLEGDHFYVDLVFYNRFTKSFVLIDLKAGKLTPQDVGQMQMYVNYYKRVITTNEENPPIGIILCANKNSTVVKFTLPDQEINLDTNVFVSKYKLYLPTEKELKDELEKEQKILEPLMKLQEKEKKSIQTEDKN